MKITEYGAVLSRIGNRISMMSQRNQNVDNTYRKLRNNIEACNSAVSDLLEVKPPKILIEDHKILIGIFEQLISAYMLQQDHINPGLEKIKDKNEFIRAKNLENLQTRKLGTALTNILTKCSKHQINHFLKTDG
ncbi:hypothetical protein [Rossellomorea sp. RS05]|uniref:hypothetical protein n=1 Tax=Rossellomorea sp. RS05 TaxID=3149166 RepID=UPI003221CFCD